MAALNTLKRKLDRLRWYRWAVAVGAAACALVIAVLWALLFLAAADVTFQLPVAQRVTAIALTVGTAGWLVWKRVAQGVRLPEEPESLALLVEQNHQLDTDLIAALQFQSAGHEPALGSPTLQHAVIQRAADLSDDLDFFEGVQAHPLPARAWLLAVTAALTIFLGTGFPQHMQVFLKRLGWGTEHYPTRTHLRHIVVNGRSVLDPSDATLTPAPTRCAEGHDVELLVAGGGEFPEEGLVRLDAGGQQVELPLVQLTNRERLARLQRALEILNNSSESSRAAASLAAADCSSVADALMKPAPDISGAQKMLREELEKGESGLNLGVAWYVAELPRHGSSIDYSVRLGDAWSETSTINMIPLPTVALEVVAETPEYSQLGRVTMTAGARQLRVLEGSTVQLALRYLNGKAIASAWADLNVDGEQAQRVELVQGASHWRLPTEGTPLADVSRRVQFAVQVLDEDGLQLPNPVSGQIQVRPDRPPTGAAAVLHRVVLPTARPSLSLSASDDFGIAAMRLRMLVEKPSAAISTGEPGVSASDSGDTETNETEPSSQAAPETVMEVHNLDSLGTLPWEFEHPIDLAALQLAKGDRLKITLELVDDRGEAQGQRYLASPLILEVSDEAGVLAAVSETDEQSERKLNELIKQQLGIGEKP